MGRTSARILCTFAVLVVYAGVLWNEGLTSNHEVLPFFKWELFSRVPNPDKSSFSARILELDGELLDEPLYFEEAGEHLRNSRSPEAQMVLQRFGQALERDEILRAANHQALFEDRWLGTDQVVRYEMVRREYHLIERMSCRTCFETEEVLGVFVTE